MSRKELIASELERIPEELLDEVLDFVRFLRAKQSVISETALLSEPALAKDWLTPEEDAAWKDL
jgi:hypothetical protein